jgi:hypothetical protein
MRIKDQWGRYTDVPVPLDIERQLYQNGYVKYGYVDVQKGVQNVRITQPQGNCNGWRKA